jgi:hypothetical protein
MSLAKTSPIYGNGIMLAPDGEKLCRCNMKKLKWYIDRNLATWESNDPPTIRLRFEPKGRYNTGDDIMLADRPNKCVVCGKEEGLNRHHIVPSCYRQFFPDEVKKHSSFDIVPLCIDCHECYEKFADLLKIEIGKESGCFPSNAKQCANPEIVRKDKVRKSANSLLLFKDAMPKEKIDKHMDLLKEYLGKDEISIDDIRSVGSLNPFNATGENINYGLVVVNNCEDLQAFVERWRNHFLATMKPQFMAQGWDVKRSIWRK